VQVSATITTRPDFDRGTSANPALVANVVLRWDLTQAAMTLKYYKENPVSDDRRLMFYIDGLSAGHVVKIDAAAAVSVMTNSSLAALTRREKRDVMIDPGIQSGLGVLAASLPVANYEEVMNSVTEIATSPLMVDALKGESAGAMKRRVGNAAFSFRGLLNMVKEAAPVLKAAADMGGDIPIAGSMLKTLANVSSYADTPQAGALAGALDRTA